jgi:small subunit ribosomal protein S20
MEISLNKNKENKKRQINKREALKSKKRQSEKKKYKTLIKNLRKEIESSTDLTDSKKLFEKLQKTLDKAAQKGIIHKNNARRRKSRISRKINKLAAERPQPLPIEED